MANPVVQKFAEENGISIYTAYERIKKDPSLVPPGTVKSYKAETAPRERGSFVKYRNQKQVIREALDRLGTTSLETLLPEVAKDRSIGFDAHNLIHVLHSMRRQSDVAFQKATYGNGQTLRNIRLTDRGRKTMHTIATRGKSPVGVDMTRPENHKPVAVGGPIERIAGEKAMEEVLAPTKKLVERPPEQNQKVPEPVVLTASTSLNIQTKWDFEDFPLIRDLASRQGKVEQAAKLLEEAGQPDLALAALEKIEYTPFEKEVLRLWESLS